LGLAAGMTAFGAWPVLPFAGLEVALLALAFHVVARHDRDFERLEIDGAEIRFEACDAHHKTRLVANGAWARVVVRERGTRCALARR